MSLAQSVVLRPLDEMNFEVEATAVAEIYLAARKRFLPYAPLAHSDDEVRTWGKTVLPQQTQITVAALDGRIVGFMALQTDEPGSWVDQLYLHPDFVGQGIGERLLAQALGTLAPPIFLYAFQENAGARRFYERHGFVAVAFGDGSGNEEGCPDVLYRWDTAVL